MKVYITKYALTTGMFETEAEISSSCKTIIITEKNHFYHKPDWHESYDEAIKKANDMKNKKITDLKKQIKKLENLTF